MTGRPIDARLAELRPHPQNYNRHSEAQVKRLMQSLETFGQPKPIVIWRGTIIAGHGLAEAAKRLGWERLLATDMSEEWTEAQASAFVGADNELARLADPDEAALAALAASVAEVDRELAALAAGTDERLKELLKTLESPAGDDPGAQVDKAEELRQKWQVEPGQLWQLGEHRLICGDCTDRAMVERVMGGEQVDLVVTDPPYAVDYAAKNRALQTIGPSNRLTTDIQGDTLGTEETAKVIWEPAFANAYEVSRNGAVIYCFAPQGGDQMMMMMMMLRAKWNDRLHQLIWRKNSPTFSMGRLDYSYQHEPILYSWRGTNHGFYGDGARSIIDCDRPSASKLHPTMKPVELIEILVRNSSRAGEIVYEPFSGSGTTLIACERLGRRCRAAEISPGYVAVALERWSVMTGRTPVLLEGDASAVLSMTGADGDQ